MKVLLLLVDGMGIGRDEPSVNPFLTATLPVFQSLFGGTGMPPADRPMLSEMAVGAPLVAGIPVDATMGYPGLPQSATGQTAILTGQNAAAVAGGHVNGHPTRELVALLEKSNIYSAVLSAGRTATSINAYRDESFAAMREGTYRKSVSTAAALSAGLRLRTVEDVAGHRAVYHDISSAILKDRGYPLEEIEPAAAGRVAASIARRYEFSFFEFFLTDLAGHRQDMDNARRVLERLDAFVGGILEHLRPGLGTEICLVITSDHGNIEDLSTPTHTRNPVPAIFAGIPAGDRLDMVLSLSSITGIAGAILSLVLQ